MTFRKALEFVECPDLTPSDPIYDYFSDLMLPDYPTFYDHLILSLSKKDIIATFNWDPFLWQAGMRINNRISDKIPKIFFLHGNVAVCIDNIKKCKKDVSLYDSRNDNLCKLLYPIKEKNYQENNFISSEWTAMKHYLSNASMLTIFGYSAPTTDKEAVALLQAGWGNGSERELEQIELIDVKPQSELLSTWDSFVHSHHYTIYNDFYQSFIAKYPRRSCDAMNMQNFYCKFLDGGIEPDDNSPWKMDFSGLEEWFKNLILSEG